MKNFKILHTIRISLMTVIITVCAWITIPFPLPFTMQTFGIYTGLLLLGGKKGLYSVLLYILLGISGLPVFSGFNSGLGHLLSPSGGYIWGFVLCAVLYLIAEKLINKKAFLKALILFAGTILCYFCGTLWFIFSAGSDTSLWQALMICVLPFIIPDLIKIVFSVFLAEKIRPLISKTIKE